MILHSVFLILKTSWIAQRWRPAELYWNSQKIAVEKNLTLDQVLLRAWLQYIANNIDLLEKGITWKWKKENLVSLTNPLKPEPKVQSN